MLLRSIVVLIIIGVFQKIPIVAGQESFGNQREIEVKITVNSTHSDADNLAYEILEATRSNLQAYNISVDEVSYDPFQTPSWDFDIFLSQNTDGHYFSVNVNPFSYPFPDAPTILTENYAGGLDIEMTTDDAPEAVEQAIHYATTISLYSIGLCEEAIPLSHEIFAEQEKVENKRYSTYLNLISLLFLEANCAITAQDFEEALRLLEQSVSLSYNFEVSLSWLRVRYYLAWVYLQVAREEDAFNLIDNAVKAASFIPGSGDDYNDALLNSARLYALMSRYDDAITNLNIYSDRFNDEAPAMIYILRGQMYLNLYEWDKSLNDFNTAIELAPEYADAYFQRGVLYYSVLQTGQELRMEALADFQYYLELAPEGEHADQAREYADKIEAELAALNE